MTAPRSAFFSNRSLVAVVLLAGMAAGVFSYWDGRTSERVRAEEEFVHRATLRHALTREILGHYEDALHGLSAVFAVTSDLSREEFVQAASRVEGRIAGVQALEWVPVVPHAARAELEAAQRRNQNGLAFEIIDYSADKKPHRAPARPLYYPILYIHPLAGNEPALGFDVMLSQTSDVLVRARDSGQVAVSQQFHLVQDTGSQRGLVMILPVYRPTPGGPGAARGAFAGFMQCVFRVHDLLKATYSRQPNSMLDMLFVDHSESDPLRRVLHYRPADGSEAAAPSEAEFRQGLSRDLPLTVGGREWHVIYRAPRGWLENEYTSMPLLRSCSLLLLAGLIAGLVHVMGRRNETIGREVQERTAELAESRRQLANTLHALPGMSYRCAYDGQLTVLFVSDGALQLTGWTAEEFLAGTVHFRDCIHPEDLGRVRDATIAGLENRTDIEVEYRLRTKSGREKWVLSRGRGAFGPDGKRGAFEGLAIDVTAQKNAESARLDLERKLLEGQKLESLGLLAGGIAHDFNNLLSSILGNASLARQSLPADNAIGGQLRAIEAASLRAAELCRQMLAYAGKGRFVVEPTDLTALANDLLPLLRISIAHQATLTLKLGEGVPAVLADATQIRQIIMNLVLNAADAIGDRGGDIVITTGVMHADYGVLTSCAAGADLPEGDYAFVEVRDTGTGMTPEVMAKIFDPFFTTKFAGRGLGLAAVLGIVRGHRGALSVESTPGVGSSFRLLLPPAPKNIPAKAEGAPAGSRGPRTGNILVIDDEDEVRGVMVAMLKLCGYTATPTRDGESGLKVFREKPDTYDAVVLDLLMPGMSGEQTYRSLRALKPGVRVLLVSGYNEGDTLGRLGGGAKLAYLGKPFTRATLERKLQDLLG